MRRVLSISSSVIVAFAVVMATFGLAVGVRSAFAFQDPNPVPITVLCECSIYDCAPDFDPDYGYFCDPDECNSYKGSPCDSLCGCTGYFPCNNCLYQCGCN